MGNWQSLLALIGRARTHHAVIHSRLLFISPLNTHHFDLAMASAHISFSFCCFSFFFLCLLPHPSNQPIQPILSNPDQSPPRFRFLFLQPRTHTYSPSFSPFYFFPSQHTTSTTQINKHTFIHSFQVNTHLSNVNQQKQCRTRHWHARSRNCQHSYLKVYVTTMANCVHPYSYSHSHSHSFIPFSTKKRTQNFGRVCVHPDNILKCGWTVPNQEWLDLGWDGPWFTVTERTLCMCVSGLNPPILHLQQTRTTHVSRTATTPIQQPMNTLNSLCGKLSTCLRERPSAWW